VCDGVQPVAVGVSVFVVSVIAYGPLLLGQLESCVVSQKILSQRAIDDLQCCESDQGTPLSGTENYNNSRALFLSKCPLLIRCLTIRLSLSSIEALSLNAWKIQRSSQWLCQMAQTIAKSFSSRQVVNRMRTACGGRLENHNLSKNSEVKTRNSWKH
jgi:hypothetical protein